LVILIKPLLMHSQPWLIHSSDGKI